MNQAVPSPAAPISAASGKPSRNILLVSYWYPPAVGAAAERVHGFARHLPALGWNVHVLTAAHPGEADPLHDVTLHSVRDPLARPQPFADFDPRVTSPAWKALARKFLFPDRFAKWQRAAEQVGTALIQSVRFDLILVSFPPASAVRLALHLASRGTLPLVLDLRDLWFGPGGYDLTRGWSYRRHLALQTEALAVAKRVMTVSDAMSEFLVDTAAIPKERTIVLPNGYDVIPREDHEIVASLQNTLAGSIETNVRDSTPHPAISRPAPSETRATRAVGAKKIVIAHVGTVIERNRPDLFLESLKSLKNGAMFAGVEFRFVGNLSADYLAELGLGDLVTTTGMVDRATASREMRAADALLLLTGGYVGRWGASGKLFEYMQAGRPVLCVEEAPDSNDRRLLERFIPDRSFFAIMSDGPSVAAGVQSIRKYVTDRPEAALELDAAVREYSRANLTARLSAELTILCGEK